MNRRELVKSIGLLSSLSCFPAGIKSAIASDHQPQRRFSPDTISWYAKRTIKNYQDSFNQLSNDQVNIIFERGKVLSDSLKLKQTLTQGGVLTFPHVHIGDCIHLTSAVVNACFASGSDKILVISLMHALNKELMNAYLRVASGLDPKKESLRGIYGPGLAYNNITNTWQSDHVLYLFRKLVSIEAKRRNIKAPKIIERFVFLSGPDPFSLRGFKELEAMSKDAVIVSSADHAHHGLGYQTPFNNTYPIDSIGLLKVQEMIQEGLSFLDAQDYKSYQQHCFNITHSDWESAGVVINAIRGPMQSSLHCMGGSDYSDFFNFPKPSWVASVLLKQDKG
ncbi:hypothetical protein [Zooshikella ganghwensis]|uniref:hypothetical protein n=1 Tax=Zooshikella ganghwensis TaxID=202772 RepID=UPI0003F95790|nr:hypothetical protein [Zooshikella ganghwensis]